MRSARTCLLCFFLLFATSVWAQQTPQNSTPQPSQDLSGAVPLQKPPGTPGVEGYVYSPPDLLTAPVRDPQALAIIQTSITAMGGAAIQQVHDATIDGQIAATPNSQSMNGPVEWKMAGAEFRMDVPSANGTASVMTGHGKPIAINGTSKPLRSYVTEALFVPPAIAVVLAQELLNPKMSLRYKDVESLGGESVAVITTALEMDYPDNVVTPQNWYFSSTTGLPVRVEFRSPDTQYPVNFIASAVDLSNYQTVSGVMFPFKVVSSVSGETQVIFTIQNVLVNSGIAPSQFDSQIGVGGAL
jgi:hypothetical protein